MAITSTFYHAESDSITAEERLNSAIADATFKANVKKQAVNITNLANNLLASASQADQYSKQTVNNMTVCAANVQVAANSIVRLAGDIGSIFSIVNAADAGTDIYKSASTIRDLINGTAYNAQMASQLAMEASAYTSEVLSATVLSSSKVANGSINNLLNILSADFDAASQAVTDANAALEAASTTTKFAEGRIKDTIMYNCAATLPHSLIKNHLNGISEKKKTELDAMTLALLKAQDNVKQCQAIVDSLTQKTANIQGFLSIAETNRTHTSNNKVLIDQIVSGTTYLTNKSEISFSEIIKARKKVNELALMIKQVIDKLIHATEMIDKFANMVARIKVLNPLISDELVSRVSTAGKDANNAVASTLVALKATLAVEASNLESAAALELEDHHAGMFCKILAMDTTQKAEDGTKLTVMSLKNALHKAYTDAKANYHETDKTLRVTTQQLTYAQTALDDFQIELRSLQSALAAANAAALAS